MSPRLAVCFCLVTALAGAGPVSAQVTFYRTMVVDPNGNCDYTTIQDAINDNTRIGSNPQEKWTILIYAGTYAESVALNDVKENIDLVGVDPDAVIIAPSSGNGITITSGAETSRNNSVRNLTIRTTSGHGIQIVKGDTPVPKNITIDNVTIEAAGTDKHGIDGAAAQDVRVRDTTVSAAAGHGLVIGDKWSLFNVKADANDAVGTVHHGLYADAVEDVQVESCRITGAISHGLHLVGDCQRITVRGCDLRGGRKAAYILGGDSILLDASTIRASNASDPNATELIGLFYDRASGTGPEPPRDIVAQGCRIEATGTRTGANYYVFGVKTDTDTFPRVLNCQVHATGVANNTIYGVYAGDGSALDPSIVVTGGAVTASCDDLKTTTVWDLYHHDPGSHTGILRASGVNTSKWWGPIQPADGGRSVIQRTVNVSPPATTAILGLTNLSTEEQEITSDDLTNPDVYRALSVTSNSIGLTRDVYIVGTDWAGSAITEKLTLQGTSAVAGQRPFRTVTKVILPVQTGSNQQVAVGTTNKLGLYYPIAGTSAVQQQARKATSATSFTIESVGTVDATYSTVTLGSITSGDSFEWAILASN
ncbi:MAG: pectinesterase family protein [Planctomycetota bacterium]